MYASLRSLRWYETRSDDPNDVIPHEDRREQRGLRLIAAWLNHDDTRAQNTVDSWDLRPRPAGYDVVGIERESSEKSTFPMN